MRRVLVVLAGVLSAHACSRSSAPPASKVSDTPTIAAEKYALPNGLEVILSEDHRLPMVAVNLWYHVGPANESVGRTGFAHLFEHMMFQGSKHVPGQTHFRLLEASGASDYNGTTDFDRTNYFETLPANQLELALWLESDRMGYLLDALDQRSFMNQQDTVRNERRQSIENVPYGIVDEELFHQLFPASHPYHAVVMGSHADIQAAKLDDVKAFFKTYYRPNNASLTIVGDINKASAKTLVDKYFGKLARGPAVPKITAVTPPIAQERVTIVMDKIPLPKVSFGWITPAAYRPGDADADLTAQILGGGKSSRLYKKLVYEQQIAQDVSATQSSLALGSVFTIAATARAGHAPAELEKSIDAELQKFRAEGPTPDELDRARNTFETRIIGGLETLGGVADLLNRYNQFVGTPDYLAQDLQRYRAASLQSIKTFASTRLAPAARIGIIGAPGKQALPREPPTPAPANVPPGAGTESVNADEAWRKDVPKPGPMTPPSLPTPASFTLTNGLTVILTERTNLPVVSMMLVVKAGGDANPPAHEGLADFTVAMLDQGTATRSALKLADDGAQIGTAIGTASSMDSSRLSIYALRKNAAAALDLLADVTLHPSFPAGEIDRERSRRLTQIVERRSDPEQIAPTVMAAALYGPHPYGSTELGTEPGVKAITRDDMQGFWKANFAPNNAALVVAGAIGRDELRALADKAFGGWTSSNPAHAGPAPVRVAEIPPPPKSKVVVVDVPGAPQTQLRIAAVGAPRSTPDYAALEVMDMILGGLFSSRINQNLRQDHGFTYGAYSTFVYRKGAGPFYVTTGVRTDATGPAVTEIFKELGRMPSAPVPADELALGRDALVRSLPGAFETTSSAVGTIAGTYVYNLGLDYYSKYPQQIGGVTPANIQDVAKRYLVPDKFVVIAVGDRAKIAPQLQKLNLGAIEMRDADGNPKENAVTRK